MNQFLRTFVLVCPIASLSLLVQGLLGWFAPQYEQGHNFLRIAGSLYLMEFICMHSSIFYEMRKNLFKNLWAQKTILLLLFGIYGFALAPYVSTHPWMAWSYLGLNLSRLLEKNGANIPKSLVRKMLEADGFAVPPWLSALAKTGAVILGLPLLVLNLPFPDGALTTDNVRALVPEHNDPTTVILFAKSMTLYFGILAMADLSYALRSAVIWSIKWRTTRSLAN